ncbi:decaprenyl-phosphate phosphoribosyltransferase [Fodinisporobacter ferrooxydans]|uniref:Decaprenyl-phosphate phosphoribosyltransferase n=1 Tax=Fodinisporobacter ferrooxydans TaxID=2901836 RepID=A0ABY4CLU5_9BACL|nr:decaprenyl-phosphate phosphoribosyltransferase [Alicyclobacillaceae bacterium MYW30-H2]
MKTIVRYNTSILFGSFCVLQIIRPKQWIKNFYVFAALIFSGNLLNIERALVVTYTFLIFCLISSSVYVLNDIIDVKKDKEHPVKKYRPLPSGKMSIPLAILWLIILIIFSVFTSIYLGKGLLLIILLYFAVNIAYSFYFKHIFLIEALIVGFGFVLRAFAGAVVLNVQISPWLFVCTILLSTFIILGKRRSELMRLSDNARHHRRVLEFYSIQLLDQFITIIVATTIMAYSVYTFSAANRYAMMYTIPFVIYGLFRYLYILHIKESGDAPEEVLLGDVPTLINIGLWTITSFLVLYDPFKWL